MSKKTDYIRSQKNLNDYLDKICIFIEQNPKEVLSMYLNYSEGEIGNLRKEINDMLKFKDAEFEEKYARLRQELVDLNDSVTFYYRLKNTKFEPLCSMKYVKTLEKKVEETHSKMCDEIKKLEDRVAKLEAKNIE